MSGHTSIGLRITLMLAAYGSLRAMGRALKIDHSYLHRLQHGQKTEPSDTVLKKLGLRRIVKVTYELRKP